MLWNQALNLHDTWPHQAGAGESERLGRHPATRRCRRSRYMIADKLCCNGNEYAECMAARAEIGFTQLDNGFAAVDDAAAV